MILSKVKDPRLVTTRRGGSLTDEDHRPAAAVAKTKAWARGEIKTTESKIAAYHANASGRDAPKPAKFAAYSAGQAAVLAHIPEHGLGAAAYALRAVQETGGRDRAREEWEWQISQLPPEIRDLVLEDSVLRNALCWNVFDLGS